MSFLTGSSPSVKSVPIYLQSSLNQGQTGAAGILNALFSGTPGAGAVQGLFPPYGGQVGAPVSGATTGAAGALASLIPGETAGAQQAGGVQAQGQTTLADLLTRTPGSYQPYYQSQVFDPIKAMFAGQGQSDIASATGGTGTDVGGGTVGGGLPTATASGRAGSDLATSLAATQGQLTYQTAEQNPSNILNALQTLQSVTGAPVSSLASILSGGVSSQTDQQNYLDALYKQYQLGATSTNQFLTDLVTYLGVQTQTPANQAVSQPGSQGALGPILQAIGPAIAALAFA